MNARWPEDTYADLLQCHALLDERDLSSRCRNLSTVTAYEGTHEENYYCAEHAPEDAR